ncbi:MAG: cyoA [Candidatus Saccharibacteria bacterium]|nr:cyoA [Candidatus Saccharibacteria bacterium]
MTKPKSKLEDSKPVWLIFYCLFGLGLFLTMLLQGADIALFNPKGLIAGEQRNLIILTTVVMLLIAVPTIFLFYFFAWKYRETNDKATYDPHTRHGKLFMFTVWAIPSVFMVVLGSIMWTSTHKLAPQKPIASDVKPLTIQVVATRWKWIFIYPEEKIATVNFVQIPIDTPVTFQLTADEAPMSSFWIPHLSGQLYAMTGHVNHLNLMADTSGDYPGSSAEINGAGFAGMKFIARVSSKTIYDSWVQDIRTNSSSLSSTEYDRLISPSENNPAAFYALAETDLYDKVVMKYSGSHDHQANDDQTDNNHAQNHHMEHE